MNSLELPSNNTAEVTLIGTGGGYGESCVIHLGNQNWVVIDSCIDPFTKKSLPLEYLSNINVNIENDVKLIVCTHWHDDHILGISQLLEHSKNAKFSMAKANDRKKFLQFVSLDYQKIQKETSNSSTEEFNICLEILEKRNSTTVLATADRTLISIPINNSNSEILSLSPSDYVIQEFDKEISTLISEYGVPNKKIVCQTPNSKCVVLFIKLGNHRALLGADLEVSNDNRLGWLNILDNSQVIDKKSSLFKIPHHGSKNGYHERIWLELLEKNPISELSPCNKGCKLPEIEMLQKFCRHSDKVYMTSAIIREKPKKRDKSIEKIIEKYRRILHEVKYQKGIIRCQIDINNISANWNVNLFEHALQINN